MRRLTLLLVAATVVVASGVVAATAPSHAATLRTALLLGDSLTTETVPDFVAPRGWQLESDSRPGIAPCDWLDDPGHNAPYYLAMHPAAVIIETAGNDATSCLRVRGQLPPWGGPLFIREYEQALGTVFALARADGAYVVMLAPPPLLHPLVGAALTKILDWAYADEHVLVATAPRLAVSNHGLFALTLPCMRGETVGMGCIEGQIPVRMVDDPYHLHFCPYRRDITLVFTCAVYSSGQERWARATMKVLAAVP